jgi:hypothetical protein
MIKFAQMVIFSSTYLSFTDKLGVVELIVWDKNILTKKYLGEVALPLDDWFKGEEGYLGSYFVHWLWWTISHIGSILCFFRVLFLNYTFHLLTIKKNSVAHIH